VTERDVRILFQTDEYRVVALDAREARSGKYLNGSDMIIERNERDALGGPVWIRVGVLSPGLGDYTYPLLASIAGYKVKP
jgi:hypothetical protein